MTNCNTMEKREYLFEHLWYGALAMGWYRLTCFRVLENYTLNQSKAFLWAITLLMIALGIVTTWKKRRNGLSLAATLLLPFETYTVLVYFPYYSRALRVTFIVAIVLITVYFAVLMTGRFSASASKGKQLLKRVAYWALGAKTIGVFCGVWFLALVMGSTYFGNPVMRPTADVATYQTEEAQTIGNNLETIMKLEESVWEDLTIPERLSVLQVVANIERSYLGIPDELNVGANLIRNDSEDERELGHYVEARRQIIVDLEHLKHDPPDEVVNTVCHEAFHAYEHVLIKAYHALPDTYKPLYNIAKAVKYQNEFADYQDADGDFDSYYFQDVEYDARKYAEGAALRFFRAIRIYSEPT